MGKINYSARDFREIREELINLIAVQYPNVIRDISDASIGSMLVDLNAAVADNLNYSIDRAYQESQVDLAQERSSLLNIARTYGLNVRGKKPSSTIISLTFSVPSRNGRVIEELLPIIKRGSTFTNGGVNFILEEDIDFKNDENIEKIPLFDENNVLVGYNVTSFGSVTSGISKVFFKNLNINNSIPFLNVNLPDTEVTSVEEVYVVPTPNILSLEQADLSDEELRWYQVDYLAQSKVFVDVDDTVTGVAKGKWIDNKKRFIVEFDENSKAKLIFGGGTEEGLELFKSNLSQNIFDRLEQTVNNTSMGLIPQPNSTMIVKYRTGGGVNTNLPANSVTRVNKLEYELAGSTADVNRIIKSAVVTNVAPALGGKEVMKLEELRNFIKYNFASQNRAVTLSDYTGLIGNMPSKFGVPDKLNVFEERNKIAISVIGKTASGVYSEQINSLIKDNIAEYLSEFRMINDYIVVKSGRIVNIGFNVDIQVNKSTDKNRVAKDIINLISKKYSSDKMTMGNNIYIGDLTKDLINVNGVVNVINIEVVNKTNQRDKNEYSFNQIVNADEKGVVDTKGTNAIFSDSDTIFEIKYPNNDIRVRFNL